MRLGYLGYMPQISSFYGISILMFFGDHNPPTSTLGTADPAQGSVSTEPFLTASYPRRARRLVLEWANLHLDELASCWEQVVNHELPGTIEPLR
jgi:hypothetical protein